uniref:Photosystem I subunit VIII n=1 Tax=Diplandrorchis sinica TaxID=2866081 RepID=A0A8F9R5W5_9ASPA|nr:photosystem I subunit VIII [Diplandrorchis sinica]
MASLSLYVQMSKEIRLSKYDGTKSHILLIILIIPLISFHNIGYMLCCEKKWNSFYVCRYIIHNT